MKQLRALFVFFLVSCVAIMAQTPTGTIQGAVADATGASVSGATVTAIESGTNETRTTTSDSSGRFIIPLVQPGTYAVKVSAGGFGPATQTDVHVQIATTSTVDFSLRVGAATDQVVVTADAQKLDLDTSNLSTTIPSREILDLPDNGRNPFDFALLAPGVSNVGGASTPHIGGSRNGNNEQLIDGVTNILPENNVGNNSSAYTPVVDSVQEVNVQTSVLEAEYGRFSGGIVSLITKGGTNQFHGTVFEFAENSVLAAKPFGSGTAPKPDGHRYQTGGTLGGPVVFPHLYNGRNKTFFFVDFESSRQANAVQQTYSVPQPAWLTGDFSGLSAKIYDPLTVHAVPDPANPGKTIYVRDPFPGNIIPAGRLNTPASKIAQAALSYFPAPSSTALLNNFTQVGIATNNYYHFDTRVDQQVTKKWHSFLRFSHFSGNSTPLDDYKNAASPGGYNGPDNSTAYSLSFNNTVTFTPSLLGEFRYGFSKSTSVRTAFNEGFNPTTLGFPASFGAQAAQNALLFPHFGFSEGYSDLGTQGYVPLLEDPLAHDISASLIKVFAGHTVKVGSEFRFLNLNFYQYAYPSGTFNVDESWTRQNPQNNDGSGSPFASFLLGLPSSGDITNEPRVNSNSQYLALYVQDDWKITRKLTVNYGLRWDVEIPRTESNNQLSYWDPSLPSPLGSVTPAAGINCPACGALKGQMVLVGSADSKNGSRQVPTQKKDFGPRIGLAYNVLPKLVFRSGFGVVFQPSAFQAAGTSGAPGIEGFRAQTNFSPSFNNQQSAPVADLNNPFPSGYQVPQAKDPTCLSNPACVQGIDIGNGISESYFDSTRNPYTLQWNASAQYELPEGLRFEVAYLGNRGIFLIDGDPGRSFDQLPTADLSLGSQLLTQVANPFYGKITTPGSNLAQSTVQLSQLLRQFPQYNGVSSFRKPNADSIYHAFTLRLDKQFSRGLLFTLAFTGGKAIDNSASAVNYLGPTSGTRADQYNPRLERSLSPYDVSRQFTGSVVYELPIGRGKALLNGINRSVNFVIGGWQVNSIVNYSDGTPLVLGSVDNGTTSESIFTFSQRPDYNGKARLANSSKSHYFDTTAFAVPAPYTIGTGPRTLPNLRNPSNNNTDLSIIKNTRWGSERYNAQIRLEMFNAFNHQVLGGPGTAITGGNFGSIGSGSFANSSRQIQLGGKFYF